MKGGESQNKVETFYNFQMPPKSERSAVVNIKYEEMTLQCEWNDCNGVYDSMTTFTEHVNEHLMQHLGASLQGEDKSGQDIHCCWRECNTDIDGDIACYLRHVYFHTFHVKIKCIGALLLEKTGRQLCLYDSISRNLIPELPECLECGWKDCHAQFENAEMFYQHVQSHSDTFPEGNNVIGGCKCQWEGCNVVVKSKHKLKDHFKSHTQEKLVACPTCGALFSCRTKFFDHLNRQPGYISGKQYQCSHCNSTFGAERLLRDHMRYHVNQYKCPYCDMTSPSPSNMRLHIKYRHSTEKPHKCNLCDYRCKSQADLQRHMDKHNTDLPILCQVPDCQYSTRYFRCLEHHFKKEHQQLDTSVYECHVCNSTFTRGSILTKHLKKVHKFNWPSGHNRFRYKQHTDGKFRLQTVRYESMELTTQNDSHSLDHVSCTVASPSSSSSTNINLVTEYHDMPSLYSSYTSISSPTSGSSISVKDNTNSAYEDHAEACGQQDKHVEVTACGNEDSAPFENQDSLHELETFHKQQPSSSANSSILESFQTKLQEQKRNSLNSLEESSYVQSNNNAIVTLNDEMVVMSVRYHNQETVMDGQPEDAVTIHITTNSQGELVLETTAEHGMTDSIAISMEDHMELEQETMYNLQMLGDVALQNEFRDTYTVGE